MKKFNILLVILLVSLSGVCFAQSNVINITETGNTQKATVDQTGILNVSNVGQTNDDLAKGFNVATISQINHNVLFNNLANVSQTGERNDAKIDQITDGTTLSYETQIGTLEAVVNQSGDDNKSVQKQGTSDANKNTQQGLSYAEIGQSGNSNFASQNQLRYGNQARLFQSGNGNTGMQAQDADVIPPDEASYNTAYLNQSGNDNTATQVQNGWANDVQAYQSGNNNVSTQLQQPNSWKSVAYVNQAGNGNGASQTQLGVLNTASITQYSDLNTATQEQTTIGANKRPNATYEPYNTATIIQSGSIYNTAEQYQTSPGLAEVGLVNNAMISQDGAYNYALQTQTGGDNFSQISQTGLGNNAVTTQNMVVVQP